MFHWRVQNNYWQLNYPRYLRLYMALGECSTTRFLPFFRLVNAA